MIPRLPTIAAPPATGRYTGGSPAARTGAALLSGALVSGIALAMIFGLARGIVTIPRQVTELVSLDLPPVQRPAPEPTRASPRPAPSEVASARNRRNKATAVVAAPVRVPAPPPQIPAATAPATGAAARNGAADQPGPGQGAGGTGNGLGGGGSGGSGDGSGIAAGPRQIRGRLSVSDFPDGLIGPGQQASVGVRYTVEIDGRASNCAVLRSSGYATVDAMACRLITQRFRYRPATNRAGQPVRATIAETHTWFNRP